MVFKSKRANVFTKSVDIDPSFKPKKFAKDAKQVALLNEIMADNFIFSSLDKVAKEVIIDAFEPCTFQKKENIITQGQQGDYCYVLGKGMLSVLVDEVVVKKYDDSDTTSKLFGELALLHNTPRAATIRADSAVSLFKLERDTFRHIIASDADSKASDIYNSLSKVALLQSLTSKQLQIVSDTVISISYNPGDVIIKKGDIGNVFYMIKSGSVLVSDVGDKFKEQILAAGEYFGDLALMSGEPRAATVSASTMVECMALDREAFNNLLGPLKDLLDYNMNMRVLTSIELFEKLTDDERVKISKNLEIETFFPNSTILKQGEKGQKFYIIKDGTVKVTVDDKAITELSAGSYFGEMALLDDEIRKATVTSLTEVQLFSIDRSTFTNVMGHLKHIMKRDVKVRLETLKGVINDNDHASTNFKLTDLKELKVLGSGTFGRVSLVQDHATSQVYALKAMLKSEVTAHKQQANVINEKNIMMCCKHPLILRLHQTFQDPRKLYMLLEFVQGGELFSVLHPPSGMDGVPDESAKFYTAGVLLAISYLHSKDIAYRDMKPENCLIDKQGYPKLVDFGFAKVITAKSYTLCGTPEYLAPEIVLGKGHNKSVDCWALGILIYEMAAGYSPFSDNQGQDQVVICRNIVNCKLAFPRNFNSDCKELIKKLLVKETHQRLGSLRGGCDDIKVQKWFNSISFERYLDREVTAPWLPKVSSITDTSNFDSYATDDHQDHGKYVDKGDFADF